MACHRLTTGFPKYGCEFFRTLTGWLRPRGPTEAFKRTPSRKVTADGTQCVTKLTKWNLELEVHYLFLLEKGPFGSMRTIYEVLRFALTANVRTDIVNISSERLFLPRKCPWGPVSV
jgi:hypothetical protein